MTAKSKKGMITIKNEKREKSGKLWNKNYLLLMIENLFAAFSFNMISTILSQYLVKLGATLTIAGIIIGMFSITALLIRPVSGLASDRYSKRNILIASNLLIGISELGYILSNQIAVIFVFRILHGIAFGMSGTASVALASEIIPKKRTGEGIGYIGLGQIMAVAVAPGFGIMISDRLGYSATFIAAFVLAVIASLLLIPFNRGKSTVSSNPVNPPQKLKGKGLLQSLVAKEVIVFSIISGVMSLNNGIVTAYILLFSKQVHIEDISAYFTVTAIVMLIIRPLSGKIMDRRGLKILVYPAFVIGILAMFLHGLSVTIGILLLAAVLKAIASSTIQSCLLAECINRVGVERSGVATSTYYIGADIGQGIGPVIGGMIATSFGYNNMFFFCGIVTFLGGMLFFVNNLAEKKRKLPVGDFLTAETGVKE